MVDSEPSSKESKINSVVWLIFQSIFLTYNTFVFNFIFLYNVMSNNLSPNYVFLSFFFLAIWPMRWPMPCVSAVRAALHPQRRSSTVTVNSTMSSASCAPSVFSNFQRGCSMRYLICVFLLQQSDWWVRIVRTVEQQHFILYLYPVLSSFRILERL